MPKYYNNGRNYNNKPGRGGRGRPYYNVPQPAEKAAFIELLMENVEKVRVTLLSPRDQSGVWL